MPKPEPLAIVGMACRFPGGANSPEEFWALIRDGRDAITEVPETRWNADRFHHANSAAPGRMVTRWGGFASDPDAIDAAFFGLSPREAARLDPQQRWLMELTWEALEDAGLPPESLSGTRTGVFVGISTSDYVNLLRQDISLLDGYTNIGSALCIAANRLSFLFNFRGPSFAVDTACSSSIVALHLGARSLWSGECDYALVSAANELLTPESSIGFSQAHMLSPNGRCRAFDAAADGYVRAEGAGAILLMPLRAAQAKGLQPRALLLATASNQDGRSSSLTVPNQAAQEEMLREALQTAGASPRDIVYVEAHGTGTPVGDPIEARALAAVLAEGRDPGESLLVGSVKTNIGHLESASGIAGLIKAVLVLEQGQVPPNLHFVKPNPALPAEQITIPTALTPLPQNNGSAPLVGVNSFGFGGSNAHALLSPGPLPERPGGGIEADEFCIFPLSARSPEALESYAHAFAHLIEADASSPFSLRELCAGAALGKAHHPLRAALIADSLPSLREQLLSFRAASPPAPASPKIAFIFSGQGPQWWAMGRQLYQREQVVRDVWEQCDEVCRSLGGPKLLEALLATEADSQLDHTDIAQPALFALQAGLVELWRSWGISPELVLGHSVGEAAAAWAAGTFDLRGIFRIIIARSRWQAKMHGMGRMLAVGLSAQEAQVWTDRFAGRVWLAAENAPRQVTLSGESTALAAIETALKGAETFCRFLQTQYAFHSAQMDAIEEGLRQDLHGVSGGDAKIPMISTVSGQVVEGASLDGDYWWKNVRKPVRFSAGIEALLRAGCTALVEIGPHPVMASALAEIVQTQRSEAIRVPSLRRGEDERATMLRGLAALYRSGSTPHWEALYARPTRALRLPAYPWQRQHLWHESADAARALRSAPPHPLLGSRQPDPQPTWMNQLDARLLPWLADHRLAGSAVLPAAAYIEMAAAAVREHLGEPCVFLEQIRFHHLLFLPDEQPVPVCVRLDPLAGTFQISAAPPDTPSVWKLHAEGLFRAGRLHVPEKADLGVIRQRLKNEIEPKKLYREWSEIGQVFGPAFQGLSTLRVGGCEALAAVASPAERGSSEYLLFPPLLDSCFHASAAIERDDGKGSRGVVASVRQVQVFQPLPQTALTHARITQRDGQTFLADISLYDETGMVLGKLNGLAVRAIDSTSGERDQKFHHMAWEEGAPLRNEEQQPVEGEVLLFADGGKVSASLNDGLQARKIPLTVVTADPKRRMGNGSSLAVDLQHPDWAERLWQTLAARGPLPVCILYLWGGNDAPGSAPLCSALLALVQARLALPGADAPARWLIATQHAQPVRPDEKVNPVPGALWGFVRTLQTEQPQWRVSLLDCEEGSSPELVLGELFAAALEPEAALRADVRYVRRLRTFQPKPSGRYFPPPSYGLHIAQPGRVDSLEFRGRIRSSPGPGEVEIEVAATGLNFRDLMKALGIYPLREGESARLGDECSGLVLRVGRGVRNVKPGDRVMVSVLTGGAFSSHLTIAAKEVWKIPPQLGLHEAASIPVVFGTAYHALVTLAGLRRGETVLIHAATGGVGLAAVQLAQRIGATILATAGSESKRAYLRSLGVPCVMDSRTLDFAEEALRFTAGRGVDVVLNSLAGAFQQTSLAICAAQGRFVEIGKRDLFENKSLPLAVFQRSLSFFTFDLPTVRTSTDPRRKAAERFFATGVSRGELAPIPCTIFPARDAVAAFRLMQSAEHIGKIVLTFDSANPPDIATEFWPDPEGTYLVTGGLGGFGLATARWLVDRGARHLALISRRGKPSPQDEAVIEQIRAAGVLVATIAADVADSKALASALRHLKGIAPPLRGVFHAAMVLRDHGLAELTDTDLEAVLAPKVAGAWNLHEQTRDMELDCFVLFSSLSSLIGSPGQANYAAANAFLDSLAHHRRAEGLPGLSVNWGQISDAGIVAQQPEIGRYLEGIGVRALSSSEALATLPRLIASAEAQCGVFNVDWEKLTVVSAKFGTSPVFRDLVQAGKTSRTQGGGGNQWREAVLRLPPGEQTAAVFDLVMTQLAATFGMTAADIDAKRPLAELGMDSLMAVELKSRIETQSGCELPLSMFNADLTAERLGERFARQLLTGSTSAAKPGAPLRSAPTSPDAMAESLRTETTPLDQLMRAGEIAPLKAAALMPWPGIVLEQVGLAPEAFFQMMSGGRVTLDLIVETPLGSVGIFMLPLTTDQVNPGEPSLMPHVLEGIRYASTCGARCVALTGLIPSATAYGENIRAACQSQGDLAAVTTGHATTIAAVIINLDALLGEAGRELTDETVLFYGIGSIGLGTMHLMLDVLPHPAELRLCDPYRSEQFFAELSETLRREHGYEGTISVVRPETGAAAEFYDASVIVGATNVQDVIDVERLAPGTLVVDDSWPHCMNGPAALARFDDRNDILITEGGFLRSRVRMSRIAHVPPSITQRLPAELPQLLFSSLNPSDITACILSALISAQRSELPPTVGLIAPAAARQHWAVLPELGFGAAHLNYEGVELAPEKVKAFRAQYGKRGAARAPREGLTAVT